MSTDINFELARKGTRGPMMSFETSEPIVTTTREKKTEEEEEKTQQVLSVER